jgi:hypothetical protein
VASSKTKRAAAVTALVASLLAGGVAAAQADGPVCHGKGMGTGAPGNDKGKGMGTGAPGNGKGKGMGTGAPSCDHHGDSDDHPGDGHQGDGHDSDGHQGDGHDGDGHQGDGHDGDGHQGDGHNGGSDDHSGGSDEGAGNGGTTGNDAPLVDVDVSVEVQLPDAGALAGSAVQGSLGIVTPVAQTVVGQAVEATDQAEDLATSDVGALVDLLELARAGATGLDLGSADAGVTLSGTGASAGANADSDAASGVADLGGALAGGTLSVAGSTTTAVNHLVAGMLLAC